MGQQGGLTLSGASRQETIWTERFTDDKLVRKVSYVGTTLRLLADPADACAPLWAVSPEELPAEESAFFAPPPVEVADAAHWEALTAGLPNDVADLDLATQARLLAKLSARVPGHPDLQRRLQLEGAMGLWELASQASPPPLLQGCPSQATLRPAQMWAVQRGTQLSPAYSC